jgi:hypothetical protein
VGETAEDKVQKAVKPEPPEVPTPSPVGEVDTSGSKKEFEERQAAEAAAQNAKGQVPEVRPQAFLASGNTESALTTKLKEEGALPSDEPMDKDAYERAAKAAEKGDEGEGLQQAAHIGTVVEVLDGPHEGRMGAVLRIVSYPTAADLLQKMQGTGMSDYTHPKEVEVAFRGDARDGERTVLDLSEIKYRVHTDGAFSGRAFVSGA